MRNVSNVFLSGQFPDAPSVVHAYDAQALPSTMADRKSLKVKYLFPLRLEIIPDAKASPAPVGSMNFLIFRGHAKTMPSLPSLYVPIAPNRLMVITAVIERSLKNFIISFRKLGVGSNFGH